MISYEFWKQTHSAPYHFPMDRTVWEQSMNKDVDSDGRTLFDSLHMTQIPGGMIVYGHTAFGFTENGEISDQVHYPVIRDLAFETPAAGRQLLSTALNHFREESCIYAFFHYFGMSACARHGKLHESQTHIHDLLLDYAFRVEHENVYYAKELSEITCTPQISLIWKEENSGNCREFAAVSDGKEVCWGQIHFLPQGDVAYLRWIYVDGKVQHQGIGSKVMNSLFHHLYQCGIRRFDTDTALNNISAQHYYEKMCFTNKGVTRSYIKA